MKKILTAALLLFIFYVHKATAQTTRNVSTYTELTAAITASADGDIIKFTKNIVITAEIASSKTLIFNGNGYTITVPVPGLDEAGKFNTSPSAFRVFSLTGAKTTTINNLTISGGYLSSASGGAITIASGHTLKINNSTISNSRSASGGGINNDGGTVYMMGCQVIRNAAGYGGGFLNQTSSKMFVEKSTFSENRSTSASGGGGAGENKTASYLYINNSTFSNNKSTEIGGAINNSAAIYAVNSSFTGNVAYGNYTGGAIGNNGGTVYAANCLFAYNYHRASGTTASPTTYVLDDVQAYSSPGNVHLYYCIYHASLSSSGVDYSTGHNINYTGNATGTDNSIFSGGALTRITDGTGTEIGDASTGKVFQPFLYDNGNDIAPTLKTGSFMLIAANRGTKAGFTSNNGSPIIGYYDTLATTPAWVNLVSSPASSYIVTTDQIGTIRADPSAVGAIDAGVSGTAGIVDNLYMLKVNYSADGSVTGGTVYGDVYPSGTSVTLTAIPNTGKQFVRWDYVVGGTGSASATNPYTVIVNKDITLVPVFQNATGGSYSITYAGNNNTSGTAPATGNYTASTTIASVGALKRSGYIFDGWNTSPNGSGTNYIAGATYSSGTNLVLYAKWKDNFWRGTSSTAYATTANWGSGVIPATGEDIVFAEDAVKDLIVDQSRAVGNIQFSAAPYKMVLGNFNITATGITNYNSTSYIQTNGTGKFTMAVSNGTTVFFPVGNSAYNPVSVKNNTGTADNFSVQVLDELYMNGSNGTVSTASRVKRTWDISKATGNGGSGIDFIFNWNAGETVSLTTPALFHYSSGWSKQTTGTTASTATSLTYTGYTGTFSPFAIADANATLPVTWLSFKVQKQYNNALLTWVTATEYNNKDFVIEHSINNKDWETIAVISAKGNSLTEKKYEYLHTNPEEGVNYYRIRQRDNDGKNSFSSVQVLQFESPNSLSIYPNPVVNGNLNVRIKKPGLLKIYTNNGQLVVQKKLGVAGKHTISMQTLAKGIYRLVFENETVSIVLQ
ncbi:MAG: InlB B-repeat-containing protein [Chitinophagaceae bacterium]|nr:InlB B-repeat-containing protein [Chitinophagaceae bacterium]